MAHLVEELQSDAAGKIAAMKAAAEAARLAHARAELMRHMRGVAAKLSGVDIAGAARHLLREWMSAWQISPDNTPTLAGDMLAFATAFCAYANHPDDASDAAVRRTLQALEAAFQREGMCLADEMAWRSECAHGWWELVSPTPPAIARACPRPGVPRSKPGEPFWQAGAAPHCGG